MPAGRPRKHFDPDHHREDMARRGREKSFHSRNIGPCPEVVNPERRRRAFADLRFFLEEYFPDRFFYRWSEDHLAFIQRTQEASEHGGMFAIAMPRKRGKTAISETAVIWSAITGRHPFVSLLAINAPRASELLDSIKTMLDSSELLLEDFPEVCFPLRALQGRAHRCKGQHIDGAFTYSQWRSNTLVLPTVAGSVSSEFVIKSAGMDSGGIRGAKHTRRDGKMVRPSMVFIDDPQDDSSASSVTQNRSKMKLVNGAVLGMAGQKKKITAICACTVIARGDFADQLLDREKSPFWTGQRYKMLVRFPERMDLWDEYGIIRADEARNDGDGRLATAFYGQNKELMDRGALVSWPEEFDEDESTALQHAMNLFYQNKEVFFAEYQNEPLEEALSTDQLKAEDLLVRTNGLERGTVPLWATHLTAFIDVQPVKSLLIYVVAAWSDDFTGAIIDYGAFPDQKRAYWTKADAQHTLVRAYPGKAKEGAVFAGLTGLTNIILGREWLRHGGAAMRVERLLIDTGSFPDVIFDWCRASQWAAIATPSRGMGLGAKNKQWSEYQKRPGETLGLHWLLGAATGKRAVRRADIDVNYWKTFLAERLRTALGDRGALSFWGRPGHDHRMLADHLTAEYATSVSANNRTVVEWAWKPDRRDNDLLDCYDDQTEVLARRGFIPFARLTGEDELATVNLATDAIEYQMPLAIIRRNYEGDMIQIGGKPRSRLNLCVTPTHRMVVYEGQSSKGPKFKTAASLGVWDKIKTAAKWAGIKSSGRVLPGTTRYGEVAISEVDLAEFLGWYVAEGSCRLNVAKGKGKSHVVVISQMPGEKYERICELLDRLPWTYHRAKIGLVLSNRQAYDLVCGLGNRYSKRAPQWIKDACPEVISAFIRCAVDGDGWRHRNEEAYATVSKGLADDMQELYLKVGFSVSMRTIPPKPYCIRGRAGVATHQFHVHRKLKNNAWLANHDRIPNFGRVSYNGEVFCATVPNGTLIVRRGGKVAVCGNCLVGAATAANMCGCVLQEGGNRVVVGARKQPMSFAERRAKGRR